MNKHTHPLTDAEIKAALRHNGQRPVNKQSRIINIITLVLFAIMLTAGIWLVILHWRM